MSDESVKGRGGAVAYLVKHSVENRVLGQESIRVEGWP